MSCLELLLCFCIGSFCHCVQAPIVLFNSFAFLAVQRGYPADDNEVRVSLVQTSAITRQSRDDASRMTSPCPSRGTKRQLAVDCEEDLEVSSKVVQCFQCVEHMITSSPSLANISSTWEVLQTQLLLFLVWYCTVQINKWQKRQTTLRIQRQPSNTTFPSSVCFALCLCWGDSNVVRIQRLWNSWTGTAGSVQAGQTRLESTSVFSRLQQLLSRDFD